MKSSITVCGVTAAPGTKATGWMKVSELYDGTAVELPVIVINGAADGRTVWMQNAVHGDEYVGAGAIHRLLKVVDPREVKGAIVALPWVNVQGFRAGHRSAPQDGLDMNRIYPGNPIEKAMHLFAHTEIVLDAVLQEMLRVADYVIDLHDGSWMGAMSSWIQYLDTKDEAAAKAHDFAFAAGMDLVWASQLSFASEKTPSNLSFTTHSKGIPSVTIEVGGQGRLEKWEVEEMFAGVANMLRFVKVIPGDLQPHGAKEKHFMRKAAWIRARRGGLFEMHVRPGDPVEKGQLVAEVRDAFGTVTEELRAPITGLAIGLRTFGVIASGQYVATIGQPEPVPA